jgi:hypothetical protein
MKVFCKHDNKRKTKTERTEETRKKQKQNKLKDQFQQEEDGRIFQKLTFKKSEMVELLLVGLETNRELNTGNLPGHC